MAANNEEREPLEPETERYLVGTDSSNDEDGLDSEGLGQEEETSLISAPVEDRYYLVYLCMILTGAGVLFPWNSFVVGIDYFQFLYPTKRPEIVIPVTYLVVTLAATFFNVNTLKLFPLHARIGFGYVMFFLALLFLPLLDIGINNCTIGTELAFYLTILAVIVVALGSGVQQSSYYGLAGMLPGRNTQAIMVGESVAGLAVSVNRIVTKAATDSLRVGAIAFFVISLLYILFCVSCQLFLRMSPFVRSHVNRGVYDNRQAVASNNENHTHDVDGNGTTMVVLAGESHEAVLTWRKKLTKSVREKAFAIRRVWKSAITVYVVFFVTLMVFPGISSEVQYCTVGDWMPIILIATFNLSDCVSRFLALLRNIWKPSHLLVMSVCRFILVPLLVFCVSPSPLHPLLPAPAIPIVLVLIVGLTTGYLGTLAMIMAPASALQEQKELTGTIMAFFLLAGLVTGSIFAYALVPLTQLAVSERCNANATAEFYCMQQQNDSLTTRYATHLHI